MNCELINNGIDSGLTHQTSDLSKVTYLRCTDVPTYVKTILEVTKCCHIYPDSISCTKADLRHVLVDSRYGITKDLPPSEYFTEWEQFTQVINTIIDIAIVHNTESIKLIFNG